MSKQVRLVTVGRPGAAWWGEPVREYGRRLAPWVDWQWRWIPHAGDLGREGRALARLLQDGGRRQVVGLAVEGERLTTEAFADRLGAWLAGPWAGLDLVVGGASGLDAAVLQQADWRWSLGPLTLAHGVAAVVAMEQVYRALSWLHGHPYHRAH